MMKINLDSIKNAAAKMLSAVSHLHFAGEVLEGFLGHKLPEDAHKLAKFVSKLNEHGGKDSWVDEARMVEVKLAGIKGLDGHITVSELKMLRGLEGHINREYGDGFFGNIFRDRFGNKQRPALLHLTTPERDVFDKITRVVGQETVYDEIVRTVDANDKLLKKYLKYLVREMRSIIRTTVGTDEEKNLAGYQRGLTVLKDDGFPSLQFATFAKIADATLGVATELTPHLYRHARIMGRRRIRQQTPRVKAVIAAADQAVINRSNRIDARGWYHPLNLFGW